MRFRILVAATAVLVASTTAVSAQQVATRAALQSILVNSVVENFNALNDPDNQQPHFVAPAMNNAIDPRFVAGVTYTSAGSDFWAPGAGYYGYSSSAFEGRVLFGVNFDSPTLAFGFDLADYNGYAGNNTIRVFNGATLLSSQSVLASNAPGGTFFGWQNLAGITRVEIVDSHDGEWTASIDNLEFGDTSVTPEPASLVLVGTGLLGVAGIVRRRRGKE